VSVVFQMENQERVGPTLEVMVLIPWCWCRVVVMSGGKTFIVPRFRQLDCQGISG
jgi:hypothetical protein